MVESLLTLSIIHFHKISVDQTYTPPLWGDDMYIFLQTLVGEHRPKQFIDHADVFMVLYVDAQYLTLFA